MSTSGFILNIINYEMILCFNSILLNSYPCFIIAWAIPLMDQRDIWTCK